MSETDRWKSESTLKLGIDLAGIEKQLMHGFEITQSSVTHTRDLHVHPCDIPGLVPTRFSSYHEFRRVKAAAY